MAHNSIQSVRNQYPGINAHLHSLWQAEKRWNRFHGPHVDDIMRMMKAQLLPMGYTAEFNESVQIRRAEGGPTRKPQPDILIRDRDAFRPTATGATAMISSPAIPLEALLEIEPEMDEPYPAILISERRPDLTAGDQVAWLELLSPTNKGRTHDARTYLDKRDMALEKGLVFIELDYLHATPPTFPHLADYSVHEPNAHPYRIVVIDPRPTIRHAVAYLHEFEVDAPLPIVEIPLNTGDVLKFDFNVAYHRTFEGALFGHDMNYAELPAHFDHYTPTDQQKILTRILMVMAAIERGDNLEDPQKIPLPLPNPLPSLEEALTQFHAAVQS